MKYIANGSAAARFGDRSGNDFVPARAGVNGFDAEEALFEYRQDLARRVWRQSAVDIQHAAFLQGLLVSLIDGLCVASHDAKNCAAENKKAAVDPREDFAV